MPTRQSDGDISLTEWPWVCVRLAAEANYNGGVAFEYIDLGALGGDSKNRLGCT